MLPPPGIRLNRKILVLYKALYGLTQAPLTWFKTLTEALAEIGFISPFFDACVFISGDHKIILMVIVDDITTARSPSDINRLLDHLRSQFKITVQGSIKYILAIHIKQTPVRIELWQRQYITNIVSRFGMQNCRPVSTVIHQKPCSVKTSHWDSVL